MKAIEGLDLAAIAAQAERERIDEETNKIRRKIAMVLGKQTEARGSITSLEKQLAKAKERLAKEEFKLEAVKRGDWSVLEEEKKEGDQQEGGDKQQNNKPQ